MKKEIITSIIGGTLALGGGGVIVADQQINPFTDKIDRVEMITASDLPNSGEQKIEIKKDKPQVRFKKFNGEVDLGITYNDVKATGNRPLLSNKMEFKNAKQEVAVYPINATSTEIEIILNEKPKTNVVSFTLDNYQNLDFFYQLELTQKEIDDGAFRPENVVGSYAVYFKDHANHIEGQTNYGTGKVGHFFRPKIIDSVGTEVWGDLHIENGILSVTIPQEFLDTATYPIHNAAGLTFGYETKGTSSALATGNYVFGSVFAGAEGTGTSMSGCFFSGDGYGMAFKGLVVVHSDLTILTNGVTSASAGITSATKTYYTVNFGSAPTLTATDYVLSIISNDSISDLYFCYDAGDANQGHADSTNSYTTPANLGTATHNNNKYSVYATYTASGGGAAVPNNDIIMFE